MQFSNKIVDRYMRRSLGLMKNTLVAEPAKVAAEQGPPTNYLDLYGLSKPPFGRMPDGTGFILFGSQRRAFDALVDHLVNGRGVVRLVGEAGIGKTEILRSAASVVDQSKVRKIMVSRPLNARISLHDFIAALQDTPAADNPTIEGTIAEFQRPPRKALLVDDFDLMPNDCVSLLLALAQLNSDDQGEPAILLSSTEDPDTDPTRPNLSQLVALSRNTIRMSRLGPAEIRQYIERSLWIAGGTTRRLITADAMRQLIARSGGVPGTVNRIMEATFSAGFARGDSMITAKTVAAAMGPVAPRSGRQTSDIPAIAGRALPFVAAGLLLTGASVFVYQATRGPPPGVSSRLSAKPDVKQTPNAAPLVVPSKQQAPNAKPVENLPPELMAALMKRGDQLLELGDIAAARLLYQRAAEAGNATAATALGKTYDPNFATSGNARDPGRAGEWYKKAAALGDVKAAELLKRLAAISTGSR